MEINHWAKLVKSGLVRANLENPVSDLLIIGHYGGFSTYKQDAWSGYAMKISDFVAEVSGITDLLAGPGILITGTGPIKTISLDGTSGGGTNFNVQPQGVIQVSLNDDTAAGDIVNVTNLDTLNIFAQAIPSGLNWAGSWVLGKDAGFEADDVVYFEDPNSGIYYTYWAYNGDVPPDDPTGTAPLPGAGEASNTFWARLGLEGPTGATGKSTGIMKLYQWSTTVPTVFPTDQSAYTWATGVFTPPSDIGLWSTSVPTNPVADEILWELTQQFTLSPSADIVNIAWTTTSPKPIAYYGTAGTDGKTVLSGSGAPDNSLGEDGDFYIDIDSTEYTMYGPKASGNWLDNTPKDLKGDDGSAGSITYSGDGAPPDGTGVTGDYYIDTTSANYTMYGPKLNNNNWSGVTTLDLKGPAGANGANGATGVVGFKTISTATYTLLAADKGYVLLVDATFDVVISIDDISDANYNIGYQTVIVKKGTGKVTIEAGTNTTVNSANNMKILRAVNSAATIIKQSAYIAPSTNGVWWMFGDLTNVE